MLVVLPTWFLTLFPWVVTIAILLQAWEMAHLYPNERCKIGV